MRITIKHTTTNASDRIGESQTGDITEALGKDVNVITDWSSRNASCVVGRTGMDMWGPCEYIDHM